MFRSLAFAAAVLVMQPAAAETAILGLAMAETEGGPRFSTIVGVPRGLTTVGDGALVTNTVYVFPERQGVTLTAPLRGGTSTVPAGTKVDSFYLCVDAGPASDGSPRGGPSYAGRARFDNPDLLAMILRPPQLAASAQVLGREGITYANSRLTGVDPFWMGEDNQSGAGGEITFLGKANGVDCRRLVFRAKG